MNERELVARLAKLERSNRRLKHGALAVVVLAAALGAMASTRPVPDVIKSHEFEVVDNSGSVRVRVGNQGPTASVQVFDTGGQVDAEMSAFSGGAFGIGAIQVRSSEGKGVATMDADGGAAFIELEGKNPDLNIRGERPGLRIGDARGFGLALGSSDITGAIRGETRQTTAASIVTFGNDKKHRVIWRAH